MLSVLAAHPTGKIRAFGALHAWSAGVETPDVAIDMRGVDHVDILPGPEPRVRVGGGCSVRRLLRELRTAGLTLPSLGLIREQTVAGATATGTHGSGASSMSQFVVAARVAHYDPESGAPTVRVVRSGVELEAVRCSLGCLGIVTELTFAVREDYRVAEVFRSWDSVTDALAAEGEWPLQQLYLLPWDWRVLAQHRVETAEPRSRSAGLYRAYWVVVLDLGLHLVLLVLVRVLRSARALRWFFRSLVRGFVPRGWRVVDRAERQLTMNHHWFRHIEIELFVERDQVAAASSFVMDLLRFLGGEALSAPVRAALVAADALDEATALRGRYVHHYPICVRRVLPDATLVSMASGAREARYAISLISYAAPSHRGSFRAVASLLARVMAARFDARPHWGKLCPLGADTLGRLYPRMDAFRATVLALDPGGRFRNYWAAERLGMDLAE